MVALLSDRVGCPVLTAIVGTPDPLLERRVEVTGQIKQLEQERSTIDAELQSIFNDEEVINSMHHRTCAKSLHQRREHLLCRHKNYNLSPDCLLAGNFAAVIPSKP